MISEIQEIYEACKQYMQAVDSACEMPSLLSGIQCGLAGKHLCELLVKRRMAIPKPSERVKLDALCHEWHMRDVMDPTNPFATCAKELTMLLDEIEESR